MRLFETLVFLSVFRSDISQEVNVDFHMKSGVPRGVSQNHLVLILARCRCQSCSQIWRRTTMTQSWVILLFRRRVCLHGFGLERRSWDSSSWVLTSPHMLCIIFEGTFRARQRVVINLHPLFAWLGAVHHGTSCVHVTWSSPWVISL